MESSRADCLASSSSISFTQKSKNEKAFCSSSWNIALMSNDHVKGPKQNTVKGNRPATNKLYIYTFQDVCCDVTLGLLIQFLI